MGDTTKFKRTLKCYSCNTVAGSDSFECSACGSLVTEIVTATPSPEAAPWEREAAQKLTRLYHMRRVSDGEYPASAEEIATIIRDCANSRIADLESALRGIASEDGERVGGLPCWCWTRTTKNLDYRAVDDRDEQCTAARRVLSAEKE